MKRVAEMTDEEFLAEYGGGARLPISYLYEDILVAQARWSRARARTRGRTTQRASAADREHHLAAVQAAGRRFAEAGGELGLDIVGRANRRIAKRVARLILKHEQRSPRGCLCCGCTAIRPQLGLRPLETVRTAEAT